MSDIDSVKVVVVGDSGVGKSSLVHLICEGEVCQRPSWTIGCTTSVHIHEYHDGLPNQRTVAVDFWDVGGSSVHRNARRLFYAHTHGIILVYDLCNRKTLHNLSDWLAEVLSAQTGGYSSSTTATGSVDAALFDRETIIGSFCRQKHQHQQQQQRLPLLMVGCKLDLVADRGPSLSVSRRAQLLADRLGAEQLLVDSGDQKCLAAASSNAVRLSRFFDRVVERRWHSRELSSSSTTVSPAASGNTGTVRGPSGGRFAFPSVSTSSGSCLMPPASSLYSSSPPMSSERRWPAKDSRVDIYPANEWEVLHR